MLERNVRWAGSSVLAVLAGACLIGAGTAAAALAGTHPAAGRAPAAGGGPAAGCRSLCVGVRAGAARVAAGQAASFGIHISPSSLLDAVTVRISVTSSGSPFPAPTFTSCGSGSGTQTCTVGLLRAGQATDLAAGVRVPSGATGGETATLSATVTWSLLGIIGAGSATGSATVDVAGTPSPPPTPPPTSSPPGGGHHPSPSPSPSPTGGGPPGPPPPGGSSSGGGSTGGPPPGWPGGSQLNILAPGGFGLGSNPQGFALPVGALPVIGGAGADGGYGGLFPVIQPVPAASGPAKTRPATGSHGRYRATAAADILPLDVRQLGIQAAGLIVLALGIAMVVVRIPLRRRRARHDTPVVGHPRRTDDI